MTLLRRLAFAAAMGCVVPVARVAAAQPSESTASARADDLNRRAIELGKKDRYVEAEALAREAWGLKQSYDIAANLGLTELELKKYRDAAEHLAYARRTFPTSGKPENKLLVEQSFARARAQVAAVVVHVEPANADVSIDGAHVVLVGQPELFVTPGAHVFDAKLEGHAPASARVTVAQGGSEQVTLVCAATSPSISTTVVPPPPPPPNAGRSINVPIVVAGYGVAAVGVGLGVTFAALAAGKGGDANTLQAQLAAGGGPSACAGASPAGSCSTLQSTRASRDSLSTASMISFIGGGAFALGTTVYLLAAPRAMPPPVALTVTPTGANVALSGHF
jgi:hypothetical protein